ncbi:hypothetical protein M8J76_001235 [Diaphorina citri]|nr:hypothetical protein M8J76_001235 [Diaphorina citri]
MANKHSSIILTHTLLTILLLQLIRTVDSSSWNPSYSNRAENALARFNSRFSKAIAEELDNSTVAMDNNTVEENMVPSSTTSDDVTYYPSRKEKPSGKVEEDYMMASFRSSMKVSTSRDTVKYAISIEHTYRVVCLCTSHDSHAVIGAPSLAPYCSRFPWT